MCDKCRNKNFENFRNVIATIMTPEGESSPEVQHLLGTLPGIIIDKREIIPYINAWMFETGTGGCKAKHIYLSDAADMGYEVARGRLSFKLLALYKLLIMLVPNKKITAKEAMDIHTKITSSLSANENRLFDKFLETGVFAATPETVAALTRGDDIDEVLGQMAKGMYEQFSEQGLTTEEAEELLSKLEKVQKDDASVTSVTIPLSSVVKDDVVRMPTSSKKIEA